MFEAPVLCDIDARGVAAVRLNDPRRHNVLSLVMQDALASTLNEMDANTSVRVLVLEGFGARRSVPGAKYRSFQTMTVTTRHEAHLRQPSTAFGEPSTRSASPSSLK